MRRLLLPTLLGVLCLALLSLPASAGRYDPRLPSPEPTIDMEGDDGSAGADIPWADPTKKLVIPAPVEERFAPIRISLFFIRLTGNLCTIPGIPILPTQHEKFHTVVPINKMGKQ
ncbi:MAG: hypothetical protein GYA46_01680 [candidate division Zixibacteria bacterium]|nr:hypothetical protein [candidate division Zixibacteria bacterium]